MANDFVVGNSGQKNVSFSNNATEQNAKIRAQMRQLLFDKVKSNPKKEAKLSVKDIQTALNITKAEAKKLYKEMNYDGKKGISEYDLMLSEMHDEAFEMLNKMEKQLDKRKEEIENRFRMNLDNYSLQDASLEEYLRQKKIADENIQKMVPTRLDIKY